MSASIQWILGALVVALAIWLLLWASPSSRTPPAGRRARSPIDGRFPSMALRTKQNQERRE